MPICPATACAARRDRLRQLLRRRNLDALLVSGAANRFYLSGFELHDGQCDESSGLLVISSYGRDWLLTDARYELAARAVWDADSIFIYRSRSAPDIAGLLRRQGAVIGYDPAHLDCGFMRDLQNSGAPALLTAGGLVEQLRAIKEPCEITALEASFALNHQCLAWLEARLPELGGISERQLAWEIERYFREHGAQGLAFASIVAGGRRAALPHAEPTAEPLGENRSLLVDLGCRVRDYCSDQTRTWWLGGEPSAEFARALALVRDAQEAALAIMRPGVACARVYEAARAVFVRAGVEKHFTHGLGHGIGLQTHEAPSLSKAGQTLAQGMVVTVEPGLYYPEWGGVRWEYTVLVEADGVRLL